MGQKSGPVKEPAEQLVKEIRRATRRQFSAEEKIRIVLSGLRGEDSIAELCRHEGIVQNLYYRWSKEFLEAGKKRLAGDTARAALGTTAHEIPRRRENGDHPAGRAVPAAGAPHPGETRHTAGNLLPLVRPPQQRRAGGAERSLASGAPRLEPHSRARAPADPAAGAGRAGAVATRAGGALH